MTRIVPYIQIKRNVSLDNLKLETVDRNSLLRIGKSTKVNSFQEMQANLDFVVNRDAAGSFGVGFVNGPMYANFTYSSFSPSKPSLLLTPSTYNIDNTTGRAYPFRFSITTFATDEYYQTAGKDVILRLLESYVDSFEALILHNLLCLGAYYTFLSASYRQAYAELSSYYLDLEAGTENIYFSVPSSCFFGTFYENDVNASFRLGSVSTANLQWFQLDDFVNVRRIMVKVSFSPNIPFLLSRNMIVAYGDYMVKGFHRYYFELEQVERVRESSGESNLWRIVFERYSIINLPAIRRHFGRNSATTPFILPAFATLFLSFPMFPQNLPSSNYFNNLDIFG